MNSDPQEQNQEIDDPLAIRWEAQEYLHLEKGPLWFAVFAVVVIGLIAVDVFFLQSWTFSALVAVMAVAVIVYSRRPPRTLSYALSATQGLHVGQKLYGFDDFRAFGVLRDSGQNSIMLLPRKRFATGVTIYFPDEVAEKIVDVLGTRLPMEDVRLDTIDVLVRKIRL